MAEEPEGGRSRETRRSWLRTPIRLRGAGCWTERLTWLAVAVGVLLRVLEYVANRGLYIDETSLLENLVGRPVFDFHTRLTQHQLAPPAFLVVERLMVRLPMDPVLAARFVPLLCAIASVFAFRSVARRYLDRAAVPLATGLFALADYLLYYASEIKQYSTEVLLTLVAFRLAAEPLSSPDALTPRRIAALTAFGALGIWFAFPLVMVLAGVGTCLLVTLARARQWRKGLAVSAMGLAWVASFGACFAVSQRILTREPFIWQWWDFAFLRLPPGSVEQAWRVCLQFANVFINPASLLTPLGLPATAVLASTLFLVGMLALGRRWRGGVAVLIAPIVFAIGASVVRKYPFHGRLLLFLVPTIQLLVAEGVAAIGRRAGRPLGVALAVLLLVQPAFNAAWYQAIQPRSRTFDSHGDLWPDLLDDLDARAAGNAWRG